MLFVQKREAPRSGKRSGEAQSRRNQLEHPRQHHDKDGVQLALHEQENAQRENGCHHPLGEGKGDGRGTPKGGDQDEMPAEAIMATTAGRREPNTPCRTARLRYLR